MRGTLYQDPTYQKVTFQNKKGLRRIDEYQDSDIFRDALNHLERRGFNVGPDPIISREYPSISNSHNLGTKGDIVVIANIYPNGFELSFGNSKNYPISPNCSSFMPRYCERRFKALTYLESLAIKNEMCRLVGYLAALFGGEIKFKISNPVSRSPEEYILNKERENPHIHGGPEILEDIEKGLTEYDLQYNCKDANKKKIKCGEEKYFYCGRSRRLMRGTVWHNINNMWWVISGGELRNIACFDLFDFSPELPRRKTCKHQGEVLRKLLNEAHESGDLGRYIQLHQAIEKAS